MKRIILLFLAVVTLTACSDKNPKSYQIKSLESITNNPYFIEQIEKLDKEEQLIIKDYLDESLELKNYMQMSQKIFPPENEKTLLEYPITLEQILSSHTLIYGERKVRKELTKNYDIHYPSSFGGEAVDMRKQNKELIDEFVSKSLETQTKQNQTNNQRLKNEYQKTINLYRELISSASWR